MTEDQDFVMLWPLKGSFWHNHSMFSRIIDIFKVSLKEITSHTD